MTRSSGIWTFLLLSCGLLVAALLSLRFGSAETDWSVLLSGQGGLLAGRAFRSLCAAGVGAALAISGLLLQGRHWRSPVCCCRG